MIILYKVILHDGSVWYLGEDEDPAAAFGEENIAEIIKGKWEPTE